MLRTINEILQIITIFIGTFMILRYVLLEPAMEEKKQKIFYAVSFVAVIVTFFFVGGLAQFLVLFFSGLNIFMGRKKNKILGFLMVVPIIGIINGMAAPIFLVPLVLRLEYADRVSQIGILFVYVVIAAWLILFYFKGKNWREWFRENMQNRKPHTSEYALIFAAGIFMMLFSRITEDMMNSSANLFLQSDLRDARLLGIAYYMIEFVLAIAIVVMILQGNKRKFYYDKVENMQFSIIATMADLVENRDNNTGGHIRRTAKYVEIIGKNLKKQNIYAETLTEHYLSDMIVAAPLHDIGKIHIPDAILNKAGKLTDEEFSIMKTHTTAGYDVLKKAKKQLGEFNYLNVALEMAEYHHEWWNGKGYPNAISGEEIPLCARIMAVADVFDALITKRCYKAAMPIEKAYRIIEEESGTHFDPVVAEVFLASKQEIEQVIEGFSHEE